MNNFQFFILLGTVYISHNLTPRFRSYLGTACIIAAVGFALLDAFTGKRL